MNPHIFLAFLLLASTVFAQTHDEESTEHEELLPDIGGGSTIVPTNSSFNEFCKLKHEEGDGGESVERFYYDPLKKQCFTFTFKGGQANENNFGTETECLEKCYTDVGEGVSLNETDVVLLVEPRSVDESQMLSARSKCSQSAKSTDSCSDKQVQRFYYDEGLQTCLAYKACGTEQGYAGRHECESSCKPADGSVCGPGLGKEPISAIQLGQDCSATTCPQGSTCLQGMIPQCCSDESQKMTDHLYGEKCSEGRAAGKHEQYFLPTVAKACVDLVCDADYECQVVGNNQFAKCCPNKKKPSGATIHRDSPLFEAFNRGWLKMLK